MMTPTPAIPPLRVSRLGEQAQHLLTPGRRGRVLAAFPKAIYLALEPDELLWIGAADTPMHRRCLQIVGALPRPAAGAALALTPGGADSDRAVFLDLTATAGWRPPRVDPGAAVPLDQVPLRITALISLIMRSFNPVGLGRLLPDLLALSRGRPLGRAPATEPVLGRAQPLVHAVAVACLDHEPIIALQRAEELVGLGEGLSPSGDDFFGGLCFSLACLRSLHPALAGLPDPAARCDALRDHTHFISFAIVSDAARGHTVEPLHMLLAQILGGHSLGGVGIPLQRLSEIGHSTGWDLLTGALTGLLVTFSQPVRPLARDRIGLSA